MLGGLGCELHKRVCFPVVLVAEPGHVEWAAVVGVVALRFSAAFGNSADRPRDKLAVAHGVTHNVARLSPLGMPVGPPFR